MLRETDKAPVWRDGGVRPTEEFVAKQIAGNRSLVGQIMEGDRKINLLSALLVKIDIASMSASVEARSPFLDHRLAELAAGIDKARLFRGGKTKAVLRDAYRGLLPSEVVDGAKRGFEIPLETWLQGPLNSLLRDTVGSANSRVSSYLDPVFVRKLLDRDVLHDRNWAY